MFDGQTEANKSGAPLLLLLLFLSMSLTLPYLLWLLLLVLLSLRRLAGGVCGLAPEVRRRPGERSRRFLRPAGLEHRGILLSSNTKTCKNTSVSHTFWIMIYFENQDRLICVEPMRLHVSDIHKQNRSAEPRHDLSRPADLFLHREIS